MCRECRAVPRERWSRSTRIRVAPDDCRKVPWPVVRGILETITNSFFECSSSNGFAVDLANQTLPRKRRTYKAGALHVLLPSVSPPLDNLARVSATIMPRADYDHPFSTKLVNIDSSKSQLTGSIIAGSFMCVCRPLAHNEWLRKVARSTLLFIKRD